MSKYPSINLQSAYIVRMPCNSVDGASADPTQSHDLSLLSLVPYFDAVSSGCENIDIVLVPVDILIVCTMGIGAFKLIWSIESVQIPHKNLKQIRMVTQEQEFGLYLITARSSKYIRL